MKKIPIASQSHAYEIARILLLLYICFLPLAYLNAQNIRNDMSKAFTLMGEKKYNEAYNVLQVYNDTQAAEYSDTCIAYYNYYKGVCLYYLKKYQEAIPCFQKGWQIMEKLNYKNCDYLEMVYGAGKCYKELKDYTKAEEYLRRTIIRGTYIEEKCAIRETTYDELADLYVKIGKPKLAGFCSIRKTQEEFMELGGGEERKLDLLFELAESYANQGNEDECIETYKGILNLIKTRKGIVNDDYLLYARHLSLKLSHVFNKPFEASEINKEIIEIGKEFNTFKEIVAYAYRDYLRYLASQGKKDSVEFILPEAEKYCANTTFIRLSDFNLYEIIGLGFWDAREKEEAVKYLEKEWKGKVANSFLALGSLGDYYRYSDPEKAISYYKKAEEQLEDGDDLAKSYIYEGLMYVYGNMGRFEKSMIYAEEADDFIRKTHDNQYYTYFISDWAAFAINAQELEKARELISKIEPYLNNLSDDSKIVIYSNCGFVYLKIGEYDKAIDIINKGIGITIRTQGDKCPILSTYYHNLGRSYMLKHDYKQALSALNKSKDLQIKLEGRVMQRTLDYIKECEGK